MTTWITPKLNWNSETYYTREDAERLVNNVTYLKEIGTPCYPSEMYALINTGTYNLNPYHSIYDVSFGNMRVETVNNTDNPTNMFTYNLETLMKMHLLKETYDRGSAYFTGKYPLYYDGDDAFIPLRINYNKSGTDIFFKGWRTMNYSYSTMPTDPLSNLWNNVFNARYTKCPFEGYTYNSNSKSAVGVSYGKLNNTSFYDRNALYRIEFITRELYNFFTQIAEIFPREE